MKLSKHFSKRELACPCCGLYIPNTGLLMALEYVRHNIGQVTVTSSTRCEKHNKEVGGKVGSKHLKGEAADIQVKYGKPSSIHAFLDKSHLSGLIGLGSYETFTHIDVRGSKARW